MNEIAKTAEALYKNELTTHVNKSFGLHEIKQAIEFY